MLKIISVKFLGGAEFGDKELHIYDNVPTVFIEQLMGLKIILQEYGEEGKREGYILTTSAKKKKHSIPTEKSNPLLFIRTVLSTVFTFIMLLMEVLIRQGFS